MKLQKEIESVVKVVRQLIFWMKSVGWVWGQGASGESEACIGRVDAALQLLVTHSDRFHQGLQMVYLSLTCKTFDPVWKLLYQ